MQPHVPAASDVLAALSYVAIYNQQYSHHMHTQIAYGVGVDGS